MFCLLMSVSLSQSAPATDGERQQHRQPTANSFVRFMDAPR